jgi:predicted lipoprotein with Yx(FWY)xxD motif
LTVKTVKNSQLGSAIVVSARGLTLYHLTSEKGGKIRCSGACARQWPPLTVAATVKPLGGAGIVASKLGVVKRPDGTTQVTYNGAPLYMFSGDTKSGTANGEGLEGVWFALSPSGAIVKPAASSSSSGSGYDTGTTTPSTGGSNSSGGTGEYGYG